DRPGTELRQHDVVTAADAELAISSGEVRLDRLHAEEQLAGDGLVRLPLGSELQNLSLAGCQCRLALERGPAWAQAGRDELPPRAFGQRRGANRVGGRERRAQVFTRFGTSSHPRQRGAELELDADALERR